MIILKKKLFLLVGVSFLSGDAFCGNISEDMFPQMDGVRRDLVQVTQSVNGLFDDFTREKQRLEADLLSSKQRCSQLEQEVSSLRFGGQFRSQSGTTVPSYQSYQQPQLSSSLSRRHGLVPPTAYSGGVGVFSPGLDFMIQEARVGSGSWYYSGGRPVVHLLLERSSGFAGNIRDSDPTLVSSNENYYSRVSSLEQDISRLSCLDEERVSLRSEVERLKRECDETKRSVEVDRQQWMSEKQTQLQLQNQEMYSSEARFKSLQEKCDELQSKVSDMVSLQSKKEEAEKARGILDGQKRRLESEVEKLKSDRDRNEEQIAKMRRELSEKDRLAQSGIEYVEELNRKHMEAIRRKDVEWGQRQSEAVVSVQGYVRQHTCAYKKAIHDILEQNGLSHLASEIEHRYANLL